MKKISKCIRMKEEHITKLAHILELKNIELTSNNLSELKEGDLMGMMIDEYYINHFEEEHIDAVKETQNEYITNLVSNMFSEYFKAIDKNISEVKNTLDDSYNHLRVYTATTNTMNIYNKPEYQDKKPIAMNNLRNDKAMIKEFLDYEKEMGWNKNNLFF